MVWASYEHLEGNLIKCLQYWIHKTPDCSEDSRSTFELILEFTATMNTFEVDGELTAEHCVYMEPDRLFKNLTLQHIGKREPLRGGCYCFSGRPVRRRNVDYWFCLVFGWPSSRFSQYGARCAVNACGLVETGGAFDMTFAAESNSVKQTILI
jgi:hypothetical protein